MVKLVARVAKNSGGTSAVPWSMPDTLARIHASRAALRAGSARSAATSGVFSSGVGTKAPAAFLNTRKKYSAWPPVVGRENAVIRTTCAFSSNCLKLNRASESGPATRLLIAVLSAPNAAVPHRTRP